MTTLRNIIAHLQARWYLWHTAVRTTRRGNCTRDPNLYSEYDAPAYGRKAPHAR